MNDQPSSSSILVGTGLADPWASSISGEQSASSAPLYPSGHFAHNDPWMPTTVQTASTVVARSTMVGDPSSDISSAWDQQLDQSSKTDPAAVTSSSDVGSSAAPSARRTPENFLGENKNLVNLDNLLGVSSTNPACANPFLIGCTTATSNPFASQQRKSPTLNEMRAAQGSTVPPIPQIGPRVETLPKSIPTLHDPNPFFS